MKKILIVLLLLVSLCGCKNNSSIDETKKTTNEETNDEALTIIKGDTIEDLHLFDNIESVIIDVIGSRDEGFKLTFKNSEAQDKFIETIKGINSATYYDANEEPKGCYDEDGNEVFGAPCAELADTHDWLDVAPIVTINYTNGESVKISQWLLTDEDAGLTIDGINGNNEKIVDLEYRNDNFLIAKTVADLVRDKLIYADRKYEVYMYTDFLKVVNYDDEDINIKNTNLIEQSDEELESYWVDYINNKFKIYENDELLDSLPTEGKHTINLEDEKGNTYLAAYSGITTFAEGRYEITIHN